MKNYYLLSVLSLLNCGILSAQNVATPNSSFETWTHTTGAASYDDATGWNDLNSTTSGLGTITCYKATAAGDFHTGAAAVKLVTKSVFGTIANGICTTASINTSTQTLSGGLPYTGRPDSVVGWYKSSPATADHGFVQLLLTGTSDTDTIGYVKFNTPATAVNTYTRFSVPMWYKSTNAVTTSQWLLSSSLGHTGQVVNSTIFVDDLDLIFKPAGIQEEERLSGFRTGPNPATDLFTVYNTKMTNAHIVFYAISGKMLSMFPLASLSNTIDLSGFSAGSYLYTIFDEKGTALNNGKLIIQK
jgi:hypothetical protein